MRRFALPRIVLITAAAFMLMVPSAQGATVTRVDGTGDVWQSHWSTGTTPSAMSVNVDLTSVMVKHGRWNVHAIASYVDLAQIGEGYGFYIPIIGDSSGFQAGVAAGPDAGDGDYWGGRAYLSSETGQGCDGLRSIIKYEANTVHLKIPRRCLGKPSAVSYLAQAQTQTGETTYTDDARSDRAQSSGFSGPIPRG